MLKTERFSERLFSSLIQNFYKPLTYSLVREVRICTRTVEGTLHQELDTINPESSKPDKSVLKGSAMLIRTEKDRCISNAAVSFKCLYLAYR